MFEIVFYKKEDDTKPVAEFIKGLEPKMKRKTLQEIQLLKEFGTDLREPYSKSLKDGFWNYGYSNRIIFPVSFTSFLTDRKSF